MNVRKLVTIECEEQDVQKVYDKANEIQNETGNKTKVVDEKFAKEFENQTFDEFIRDYIENELNLIKNSDIIGDELPNSLTEEDFVNGTPTMSVETDERIINQFPDEAAVTLNQLVFERENIEEINPFTHPGRFANEMIFYGVHNALHNIPMFQYEELLNNEVELNDENINEINSELKGNEPDMDLINSLVQKAREEEAADEEMDEQ